MSSQKRPNFLVIVADDLGFSDCGCFGSEIQTPNLDRIGMNGLRFTEFHSAAACSPTRAMLMTGTDHHLVGLGQLAEFTRASPAHQGQPGHEGYLTFNTATLPELLRDQGYGTMMAGKWHLGLKPHLSPAARGFEKSYSLLPGCANHYGWEPQLNDPRELHSFFETAVTALHMEGTEYVKKLPEPFYSSDFYADKIIEYIKQDRESSDEAVRERPFFAYLPFSAPHWPLQAPRENVEHYKGRYEAGPEVLRQERLARLKKMGLIPEDAEAHPVFSFEEQSWEEHDDDWRAKSARSMEVYAGMVERIDYNVGKVLDYLEETGQLDNTYVMFMSDNGAEGNSFEAFPVLGEKILDHIGKYYDNSLENLGNYNSYCWYGHKWAQAGTAPSRLWKGNCTEGGIRVPMILYNKSLQDTVGGRITNSFCTVMDILPTLLDLAGILLPTSPYKDREIEDVRGLSWRPSLEKGVLDFHPPDHVVGWELNGSAALRKGNWKIVNERKPYGPAKWELFDLSADLGEIRDLSDEMPDKFAEMKAHWEEYKTGCKSLGTVDEWSSAPEAVDEFEDTGKWIRFLATGEVPEEMLKHDDKDERWLP